jgi:hypothetical protein
MNDRGKERLISKQMNPIRISCKEDEWRQILEQSLAERREVDLVKFLGDYDADYCHELAQKHSMVFQWAAGNDYAFFKSPSFS